MRLASWADACAAAIHTDRMVCFPRALFLPLLLPGPHLHPHMAFGVEALAELTAAAAAAADHALAADLTALLQLAVAGSGDGSSGSSGGGGGGGTSGAQQQQPALRMPLADVLRVIAAVRACCCCCCCWGLVWGACDRMDACRKSEAAAMTC